jgi:hypothetical protein
MNTYVGVQTIMVPNVQCLPPALDVGADPSGRAV